MRGGRSGRAGRKPLKAGKKTARGRKGRGHAGGEGGERRPGRLRLLFVCTGNTCRSPLAEAIARAEAERRGWTEVEARSAGTFALHGQPASEGAEIVARRRGLALEDHRSGGLLPEALEWADLVLGMGPSHVGLARELREGVRAELLSRFLPEDHPGKDAPVPDPIGGTLERYEETFELLEAAVRGLFDELAREASPG